MKKIYFLMLVLFCALFICSFATAKSEGNLMETHSADGDSVVEREFIQKEMVRYTAECTLSVKDAQEFVYPMNSNGETYGPDVKENVDPDRDPDLILACNKEGVIGYIRNEDLEGGAASLEEAKNWKSRSYTIPMYLEDGCTEIGLFEVDA